MERQPVKTIPIHEHLRPRLCDTYENDSIFDKFEVVFSGDAENVMTGSYNNNFMIYPTDPAKETEIVLQADKSAFKAKKVGVPTPMNKGANGKKSNSRSSSPAGPGSRMKKETDADQIDFNKKILHMSWHPYEDSIAIAATNNVSISGSHLSRSGLTIDLPNSSLFSPLCKYVTGRFIVLGPTSPSKHRTAYNAEKEKRKEERKRKGSLVAASADPKFKLPVLFYNLVFFRPLCTRCLLFAPISIHPSDRIMTASWHLFYPTLARRIDTVANSMGLSGHPGVFSRPCFMLRGWARIGFFIGGRSSGMTVRGGPCDPQSLWQGGCYRVDSSDRAWTAVRAGSSGLLLDGLVCLAWVDGHARGCYVAVCPYFGR